MTATVLVRAGEELTISYLPAGRGSVTRRSTIRELWHFTCCCRRCGDPTKLGNHASTALQVGPGAVQRSSVAGQRETLETVS